MLLSRNVNGLTNIWKYDLTERSLTQITLGTGPDYSPMPDPGGKGIYFVNGQASGFLTAYHFHSKESTDIVSENATSPPSRGTEASYVCHGPFKPEVRTLGVGHRWPQQGKTRHRRSTEYWVLGLGQFSLNFFETGPSAGGKAYIVGADGSGLRQLPPMGGPPDVRYGVLTRNPFT